MPDAQGHCGAQLPAHMAQHREGRLWLCREAQESPMVWEHCCKPRVHAKHPSPEDLRLPMDETKRLFQGLGMPLGQHVHQDKAHMPGRPPGWQKTWSQCCAETKGHARSPCDKGGTLKQDTPSYSPCTGPHQPQGLQQGQRRGDVPGAAPRTARKSSRPLAWAETPAPRNAELPHLLLKHTHSHTGRMVLLLQEEN